MRFDEGRHRTVSTGGEPLVDSASGFRAARRGTPHSSRRRTDAGSRLRRPRVSSGHVASSRGHLPRACLGPRHALSGSRRAAAQHPQHGPPADPAAGGGRDRAPAAQRPQGHRSLRARQAGAVCLRLAVGRRAVVLPDDGRGAARRQGRLREQGRGPGQHPHRQGHPELAAHELRPHLGGLPRQAGDRAGERRRAVRRQPERALLHPLAGEFQAGAADLRPGGDLRDAGPGWRVLLLFGGLSLVMLWNVLARRSAPAGWPPTACCRPRSGRAAAGSSGGAARRRRPVPAPGRSRGRSAPDRRAGAQRALSAALSAAHDPSAASPVPVRSLSLGPHPRPRRPP